MSSSSHGSNGHTMSAQSAKHPERSRNAKAQARHRAKRKAYIEQLEQTVTKLQTALGVSPDQVAALPPPLAKIRELEQENARLVRENEDMRRALSMPDGRGHLPLNHGRRDPPSSYQDGRCPPDRDYKRKKLAGHDDQLYMSSPNDTPPLSNEILSRPPPLTIPQPLSHHYGNVASHSSSSHAGPSSSTSLFPLNQPAFQMPNTPSGSSSASSPPFSPVPIPSSTHSPVSHRQSSNHHGLPSYPDSSNHYGSVKVEDDHYGSSNHRSHNSGTYSSTYPPPFPPQGGPNHDVDNWTSYSSDRAHLQR